MPLTVHPRHLSLDEGVRTWLCTFGLVVGSVEVSYATEAVKLKLGFSKQKGGL
jgi:hypothetical protein